MGNATRLVRLAIALACASLLAAAWRLGAPPVVASAAERPSPIAQPRRNPVEATSLRSNPFRLDRRMGAAPTRQLATAPEPAQAPASMPRLTGIVWSADPAAVLEGLPGADGAVVMRLGQRAFGATLDRIDPAGVRLTSGATVWQLTLAQDRIAK